MRGGAKVQAVIGSDSREMEWRGESLSTPHWATADRVNNELFRTTHQSIPCRTVGWASPSHSRTLDNALGTYTGG